MAWTSPLTATLNGTLTAAQFNSNIRDNFLSCEVAKTTASLTGTPVTTATTIKVKKRRRYTYHRHRCGYRQRGSWGSRGGWFYQNQTVYVTTGGFKRKTHMVATASNVIAERESASVNVNKSETTSSTSYTNLKTTGPSVSVQTGGSCLVFFAVEMQNSSSNVNMAASVAVSGASTVAASDEWAVAQDGMASGNAGGVSGFHRFTGLTPGTNTFTMKYKVSSGTGTFNYRQMSVIAL